MLFFNNLNKHLHLLLFLFLLQFYTSPQILLIYIMNLKKYVNLGFIKLFHFFKNQLLAHFITYLVILFHILYFWQCFLIKIQLKNNLAILLINFIYILIFFIYMRLRDFLHYFLNFYEIMISLIKNF